MSGVAQALNMTRSGGVRTHATARERREYNAPAPAFMGHHSHLGYTRQVSGRGQCSAARPPSPHLAMGRSRNTSSQFDINQGVSASDNDAEDGGLSKDGGGTDKYSEILGNVDLQHQCDDLERLLVRKISAKQPTAATRVSAHRLSECARCTIPSGRDSFGRSVAVPATSSKPFGSGGGVNGSSRSKYAHIRNAHKHVERPNPYAPRVAAQASKLQPGKCRQLAAASAWRSVPDLAGAGRLPPHGAERNKGKHQSLGSSSSSKRAMNLPADRNTGANDLRQRIIRFFAYHDMDESGECSVAELRSALAPLMEGVPFHVMAALLDRYDANGDGSVSFSEIADRLMLVVEQPDDLPLPPAPSNVNGYSKSAAGEAGEKRRAATAAVLRRADQLEAAWVHRLGSKLRVDTPSELARFFRKALQWHDLSNKGVLDASAFTKMLQDAMPTATSTELQEVLRRYEQSSGGSARGGNGGGSSDSKSGIVPLEPAVRRMVALTMSGAGGRQANASWEAAHALPIASLLPPPPPPTTIARERQYTTSGRHDNYDGMYGTYIADTRTTESAHLARRLLELEDDVVYRLRAKMRNDNPLELRRVLKNLIRVLDTDSDLDLGYHQLLPGLRLLLNSNPNDANAERELKHLVLGFDADQSGSVNLEELVARLQGGLVRVNAALVDRNTPHNGGNQRQEGVTGRKSGHRSDANQRDQRDGDGEATVARREEAAQNNAIRTINQNVDSPETAALFAGPPPEPTAAERACTVDALEKRLCATWLSRLPAKAVQGSRAGLLKHVKTSLAKFAQQQWHGQVVKVHHDSTVEVALSTPPPTTNSSRSDSSRDACSANGSQSQNEQNQNNRNQNDPGQRDQSKGVKASGGKISAASATTHEGKNKCDDDGRGGGVVVSLPSVAVTPLGCFKTVPRVGRVWVGDESKLAPGAACTFRTATLLTPSEFLAAAREILPPMDEEDLNLLLERYVEGGGPQGPQVVVVSAVAQRLLHTGLAAGGTA